MKKPATKAKTLPVTDSPEMAADDKSRLKAWTARIPEPADYVESIDVLRLAATNEAYRELCEKLANILIYGSRDLRTTIVTNLVMIEDATHGCDSISWSKISREERTGGAQ